jgi:hypothetical protein
MNCELEGDWKQVVVSQVKVLCRNSSGENEENHERLMICDSDISQAQRWSDNNLTTPFIQKLFSYTTADFCS